MAYTIGAAALVAILLLAQPSVGGTRRQSRRKDYGAVPTFKETPQNITVGPGGRAHLKCQVENLGTKTVTWRRADQSHPLTIGLFTFVSDTRVSVDFNQRINEYSLIIQDVKPEDAGTYRCIISTKSDTKKEYDIQLNVKTVQVTGQDYVEKGEAVHLICNATGKPDPPHDVSWFKDGEPISSDAKSGVLITKKIETKVLISVLVIKKSRLDDSGRYVCRSSNRDHAHIQVIVLNVAAPTRKRGTDKHIGGHNGAASPHSSHRHIAGLSLLSLLVTLAFTRNQRPT